ncbi:MAG: hypothetical protein RIM99_06415 [Cyclobacteriaceae bacterium]
MSDDLVWYAAYGSNIQEERFLCYIRGGRPNGRSSIYEGCRDKTLPVDDEEIYLKNLLYFAKRSKGWNHRGVAFISPEFDDSIITYGRIFLIKKSQFIDLFKQETNTRTDIDVDFECCIEHGNLIVKDSSWYGNVLHLGSKGDYPIFTITNKTYLSDELNAPDQAYLQTIAAGIAEVFNVNTNELIDYFIKSPGINRVLSSEQLVTYLNKLDV